jgi:Acyl-protein synthetase, LuxE
LLILQDYLTQPAEQRNPARLEDAIIAAHKHHFERNTAYRRTVAARGVGHELDPGDLARILRPAALTFKSYSEIIGLFPQDDPYGFLAWLQDQISEPLPAGRQAAFRRRYGSLEGLLCDIERVYADVGLEIVTSSGTSGRASIVPRSGATVDVAVQAFFTGIRELWGVGRGTALVFVMPEDTRVAMARSARFGTRTLDWTADSPVYYTMPFSATPDQMRVRAGRTFRRGVQGLVERRILHPFMKWANGRLAEPRTIAATLTCLRECAAAGRPVMLMGGLAQLHPLAGAWASASSAALPPGSRVATGGGVKGDYPLTQAQIRADLRSEFGSVPVSDVYGMAEANWAAFECACGNYHIPPWVHAVVTDDDRIVEGPEATGLLAFFDPVAGGDLIPPFFQTADRVRLVVPGADPALSCLCGYNGSHIKGVIQRVDLTEEAGCAAQV